jgi:hypothetical protein
LSFGESVWGRGIPSEERRSVERVVIMKRPAPIAVP